MSKRMRTLLLCAIAAVVVGLLVAAVVLWLPEDETEETVTTTTTETPVITVVDKTVDADGNTVSTPVKSFEVQNPSDSFTVITRDDSTMAVEAYADLLPDTVTIRSLCSYLADLTAVSIVNDPQEDSVYGFDEPSATVTATYHDDSTATLIFGIETPYETGYYCRLQGDDTLYIVESSVAELFQCNGISLIGKSLISAPSVNDDDENGSAQLTNLQLGGTVRDQAVQIINDVDDQYSNLTYTSTYVITSPFVRAVDSDSFATMASTMTSLTASGVAAAHPDDATLESYGLTNPSSVAVFTLAVVSTDSDEGTTEVYNEREHIILLGNRNEDGYYYALVDAIDAVYLLSDSAVPWAEQQYNDLITKLLFLKDITTVSTVTVTENGQATVYELEHHPDESTRDKQLTVTSNGETYDTAEFRILYQLMISIRRVDDPEEGATASGTPVLTLEMEFNDGSTPMVISMYPMTASRYLCVTDDGDESAVSIAKAEDFLKQYHNYLNGDPVTSPY